MVEKKMTREDAAELYRDLHKTMKKMKTQPSAIDSADKNLAKQIADAIKQGMAKDDAMGFRRPAPSTPAPEKNAFQALLEAERADSVMYASALPSQGNPMNGARLAIVFVLFFAGFKLMLSGLDYAGLGSAKEAEASQMQIAKQNMLAAGPQYSKEELAVLRALDARRATLEERAKKVEAKELDFERRSKEFAVKLTELRDLTNTLKTQREQQNGQRKGRIEHLANVYGAMNPEEAAKLMEQLDITIAVDLLEHMPEKRIGQILSIMGPERALVITRMLSEKTTAR